jgi:pyruvate/2-oxoglutarate dehydrogenase complex dihydrolipoamide dehydrogenase (E3) component
MTETILTPDICIIGAGSGGLSVASGAAQMGADVVLLEGHKMGGDCLNTGCVPSKAILAAAHKANDIRKGAKDFGVESDGVKIDMAGVHHHVHGVIGGIAPHDSVERFESLGVNVISDYGTFNSPTEVQAGNIKIRARYFVVATGSTAFVPPIKGVETVDYLTNENIFDLTTLPDHLIIVGGGPIGCEMAQSFRHLGAEVSLLSMGSIMEHDDPDIVDVARQKLMADGIQLYEGSQTQEIIKEGIGVAVKAKTSDGEDVTLKGSHLLIATGRRAAIDKLNLDKANVQTDRRGIMVDAGMRTSNKKIFAIGDATNTFQFTHIAGYQAGIVIQRALFKMPAKANYDALPWVTYTDPEVANVGMNETMATKKLGVGNFEVLKWDYAENDRARAERSTEGFVKVIIKPNGKILGATIVGKGAGELLMTWSLAISKGLKVKDVAQLIVAYPTVSEINKRVAGSYFTPKIFSPKVKKIVGFIAKIDKFLPF